MRFVAVEQETQQALELATSNCLVITRTMEGMQIRKRMSSAKIHCIEEFCAVAPLKISVYIPYVALLA